MTLTDFLLARIAEDDADIRNFGAALNNPDDPMHANLRRGQREAEAKRRIVELHNPLDGGSPEMYPWTDHHGQTYWPECAECSEKHVAGRGCATLRAVADVYADHPDYREEWKP